MLVAEDMLDMTNTFEALMSMRTKLGLESGVIVLYAPVAEPGLIRNLSSYL